MLKKIDNYFIPEQEEFEVTILERLWFYGPFAIAALVVLTTVLPWWLS